MSGKLMEEPFCFPVTIDKKDCEALDKKRGLVPRQAYVRQLILNDLQGVGYVTKNYRSI